MKKQIAASKAWPADNSSESPFPFRGLRASVVNLFWLRQGRAKSPRLIRLFGCGGSRAESPRSFLPEKQEIEAFEKPADMTAEAVTPAENSRPVPVFQSSQS